MYLGNIMLLVLNLPLIGMWVQLLKIPYPLMMPMIILFCLIGAYSIANSIVDIYIMLGCGIIGYVMKKLRYDTPPLVLAFVLGPMLEYYLKSSLMLSHGSFQIFFSRPISAGCLSLTFILLALPILKTFRRKRESMADKAEDLG
jgi:putative tricarboxylic transport membrane protein